MNLVLFDLDNTLLAGDSDYEWGQFLIAKGAVDGPSLAKLIAKKEREYTFEPLPGEDADRRREIEVALQRLPTVQREVLVLKIWNELTFEQIGATLEIPPNTAASRYRYALAALRKELKPAHHG